MKKYSKEERIKIGKEIYDKELSIIEAAIKYNINQYTARDYMREYRDINHLNAMNTIKHKIDVDELAKFSKERLIEELIKAKVEIERVKKGYQVIGGGQKEKYVTIN